jgi:ElaB/YqjD/DUF883 family membrane-anchored ribosome-binding protein
MTTVTQLQLEAAAQRAGLSNTLGQLREGVRPSAISAELSAIVRDSGVSLLRNLADSARNNPVPALLIGAGLTMLLTRTTGGDVMSTASSALKAAAAAGTDAARTAADGVRDTVVSAAESGAAAAKAATDKVADAATDTAGAVRARMSEATDAARARAADEAGQIKEGAAKLAGETQALTRLLEDQPALVAAIGAAVGALFGAALPASHTEKELLGKVGSDAIGTGRDARRRAKEVVGDELASAGEKLGHVAEKAVEAAAPEQQPTTS